MSAPFKPLSSDVLDYWRLSDDGRDVLWRTQAEAAGTKLSARQLGRLTSEIAGKPAGTLHVFGRGRVAFCMSRRVLTCDIVAAIRAGYFWRWDIGSPMLHLPSDAAALGVIAWQVHRMGLSRKPLANVLSGAATIATQTWQLGAGGELCWRVSPHPDRPTGSPVAGTELVGGERFVKRHELAFLVSDVRHLLEHGHWPWETKIDWD